MDTFVNEQEFLTHEITQGKLNLTPEQYEEKKKELKDRVNGQVALQTPDEVGVEDEETLVQE